MNCPQCGLEVVVGQRFCRSCGASLQLITRPLSATTGVDRPDKPATVILHEKQRPNGMVFWGFIAMFVGAVIGVTGKKLMHQDVVTFVGILVSLVGLFLTALPYALPLRRKHLSSPTSETGLPISSSSKARLPQPTSAGDVPSITERTTDLLRQARAINSSPKED